MLYIPCLRFYFWFLDYESVNLVLDSCSCLDVVLAIAYTAMSRSPVIYFNGMRCTLGFTKLYWFLFIEFDQLYVDIRLWCFHKFVLI